MKNWLLKKRYCFGLILFCFVFIQIQNLFSLVDAAKEAESVALGTQAAAMAFDESQSSKDQKFTVPRSSLTVFNLQKRRREPPSSVVINQAPDIIDETKTGSSPGVVAGAALGAGVLGAAAGAGAAHVAMQKELEKVKKERDDALKRPLQAALDKANTDLATQTARANAALAELAGRPQLAEHQGVIQARNDAITARQQAEATLATRDQEVATLQAQLHDCGQNNNVLTAKITELTKANQDKDDFIATLQQQLEAAKAPHDPQTPSPHTPPQSPSPSAPPHQIDQSAIHDSVSVISVPDVENSQLQQAYSDLNSRYQALYNVAQNLEAKNQELAQQLAAQQQGQNGQNSELVTRLNDCLSKNQLWQQEVEKIKQEFNAIISQKDDQINQLTSENRRLNDAFSKVNEQNGQFKDSILALQEENNQLKNTLQRYEAQYNLLQQKFDAALSERDAALNQVQQLQAQLSQLGSYSSDLAWARTEIDRLTQENAQLKRDYDGLHQAALAQINQITQEKDGLVLQLQQLQSRFDALQAENADYAVQIAKAQQDAADQKTLDDKTIQDQATEITKLKAEISRLEAQIAAIGDPTAKDAEIAQLKAVLQKATDELRNCQTSAADLQAQLEQVKALVERFKREKLDLESENKQLRDSLDQAKQELEAEKQKSRREMVDLRRQLADLQQQLDDCTTRNISLLAQIQRLTTQFSGPLPYGSSYGSSLYSTGLSGHPSSRRSNGSSQSLSAPISINLGYPPNLSGYPQSTQTHDQVDPSASIISASDSIITETRPNVPPPAPTSRPQSQSSYNQTEGFPEEDDHNDGGGAGTSHFTRPEASLVISEIHPPAPAPSAKKKGALQSDVSRIAQGPSTADLLGLSPIQGETERFQKDASSASSLMQASGRPR